MIVKFRFSRRLIAITGAIIALLVVGYMWGFQTALCLELRYQARKYPILNAYPQSLPAAAPSQKEGIRLSHAGFVFEVPWRDLDNQRSKTFDNIAVFCFRSGKAVTFFGPSPDHKDLMSELERDFGGKAVLRLFGTNATKSNYAFYRTMLELTPERLKPWMSQREAAGTGMLLTIKAVSSVGGETGLFTVDMNGWKGFQFDDPTKKPKRVTLELYDAQDRHVEVIWAARPFDVTQSDINRLLLTLKPLEVVSVRSRAGGGG